MNPKQSFVQLLALLALCATPHRAVAEVAVLSNRTTKSQVIQLLPAGEPSYHLTIPSGGSRPVFFSQGVRVRLGEGLLERNFPLSAGSAYFFTRTPAGDGLHLEKIGLGLQDYVELAPPPSRSATTLAKVVVPVKLLVDDDEPTHRKLWEPRLRKRVAQASKILEQHCGIALRVVAVATWESDDSHHEFSKTLREFEQRVTPKPAALAIGFSSQYRIASGRVHMGGTRGPLHPYIILKERARRVRETERLELLVHELGHYLGASHSPEPQSVMRPLLTSGQQRRAGARIQFDPVNTLLMAMMADEMRRYGARHLTDVSGATKARMLEIYGALRPTLPDDPAARQFEQLIAMSTSPPLVDDTQRVLRRLVLAARQHRRDGRSPDALAQQPGPAKEGDKLTNLYVRQAALAADGLAPENAAKAMLLALGIFMDDTNTLRGFAPTRALITRVESDRERRDRVEVMGSPTMHDRGDLAKHFFVSAHVLVTMGPQASRTLGLAKEMVDAQRGTGFSFADMAANRAGIVFAERLLDGTLPLEQVAASFTVADYLPDVADLAEGLRTEALQARFGGDPQANLLAELQRIETRVLSLPVYTQEHPRAP